MLGDGEDGIVGGDGGSKRIKDSQTEAKATSFLLEVCFSDITLEVTRRLELSLATSCSLNDLGLNYSPSPLLMFDMSYKLCSIKTSL